MLSLVTLLNIVVYLLIAGAICYLLWWLIGFTKLPEPFAMIARIIVGIIAVLVLINLLLELGGYHLLR